MIKSIDMKYIQILFGSNRTTDFQKNISVKPVKILLRNILVMIITSLFIAFLAIFGILFLQEKHVITQDRESLFILSVPFIYGSLILTGIHLFFNKKIIKSQFTSLSFRDVIKHVFFISLFFYIIIFTVTIIGLLNDPQATNEILISFKNESSTKPLVNLYVDMLIYISIWLLVGFGEEVFFRGIVYRVFRKNLGIVLSIIISTAIFALSHFPSDIFSVVVLALFGIVTAWYYEYKNNLLTISIFHLLYDLIMAGTLTYLAAVTANYLNNFF